MGGVLLCIGLAAFAVLALASRKVMLLERGVEIGDIAVLGVFAAFASFCAIIGWRLLRSAASSPPERVASIPAERLASIPSEGQDAVPAARRFTVSQGCAAGGVLLLVLCVLVPAHWYPVVLFFAGLALLAISHGLTPCVERLEQLRNARDSLRQL